MQESTLNNLLYKANVILFMEAKIVEDQDHKYFYEIAAKLNSEVWDVQHYIKTWVALVNDKPIASISFGKYGNQYMISGPLVLPKYAKTVPSMLIKKVKEEARKRGLKVVYQTGRQPKQSKLFGLIEADYEEVPKEFLMCFRCKKFRKTCFPHPHKLIID